MPNDEQPTGEAARMGMMRVLAPLIVSAGLTILLLSFVQPDLAYQSPDSEKTFLSMTHGWAKYLEFRREWRSRVLSTGTAAALAVGFESAGAATENAAFACVIPAWVMLWVTMINLVFILLANKQCLYFIFGCFAGVMFGYAPTLGGARIYPWDLPALFIFSLAVLLLRSSRFKPLWIVLPLGMLFKETAVVLSLAFLLSPGSWGKRLARVGGVALACLLVKFVVDWAVSVPVPIATMTTVDRNGLLLPQNLASLRGLNFYPLFVNGGALAAFLLLPGRSVRMLTLKAIALLFTANIFVFGAIREYRIWFEMIPVALYGLEIFFNPEEELQPRITRMDANDRPADSADERG